MRTVTITVPYGWAKEWPTTRGRWGSVVVATYDDNGDLVDIDGDWSGLTSDELAALEELVGMEG